MILAAIFAAALAASGPDITCDPPHGSSISCQATLLPGHPADYPAWWITRLGPGRFVLHHERSTAYPPDSPPSDAFGYFPTRAAAEAAMHLKIANPEPDVTFYDAQGRRIGQ